MKYGNNSPASNPVLKDFGWQGFLLRVPRDWELSACRGDFGSGYAALDDGKSVRLQVRWNSTRTPRLARDLQRYRRALEKELKRQVSFSGEALSVTATAFRWKREQEGRGVVFFCERTRRTFLLETLCDDAGQITDAERVLATALEPADQEGALWAVYDFSFITPAGYLLQRPDLMPGRLQFHFRGPHGQWLHVERWATAAQWLKKVRLEQWPAELLKLLRLPTSGLAQQVSSVRDFAAVDFKRTTRRLLTTTTTHGVVWHCPADDKLFAVIASGRDAAAVTEKTAASVQCPA